MSERTWWKEAIVYQIYPRSFKDTTGDGIGDLKGVISKLDYLKELGVNCVWMSPCFKSPNYDNGYDVSDYTDIMEEFGTMADFDEMLAEMHKRGIKLLLDLVANHSSDQHPWFLESKSSKDNPKRDFYIWRPPGPDGGPPNNWTSFFSGPAWEYDETTGEYYLHLFAKQQPDLNWENPKLREAIYDVMRFWLNKGVDGFRMDAIAQLSKPEGFPNGDPSNRIVGIEYYFHGPLIHKYLHEMYTEVLSKYDCMTVGETPDVTPPIAIEYSGYDRGELSCAFQFQVSQLRNEVKWFPTEFNLKDLKKVHDHWQSALEGKAWNSIFLSNHDQPRAVSWYGNDAPEFREASAKMLGTVSLTLKGTPYIYQGEELGMTNVTWNIEDYNDVEIKNYWKEHVLTGKVSAEEVLPGIQKTARDNARTPMQWDSSENAGFTTGKPWLRVNENYTEINAADEEKDENSVLNYYRRLIELRKSDVELFVYGMFEDVCPEDENIYAYTRTGKDGRKLLVIANWTKSESKLKIDISKGKLLLSNYNEHSEMLKPYEARIYLFE